MLIENEGPFGYYSFEYYSEGYKRLVSTTGRSQAKEDVVAILRS